MSHMTGDDIETALEIIENNGGLGEWEAAVTDTGPQRWLFPRSPGADEVGRCEATAKTHKGTHQKNAKCKDFAPDSGGMYLSRAGIGPYDTDVETVAGWLGAPRNIVGGVLLLGLPGTGKSALAQAACTRDEREVSIITATPDHTKDSLFLRFVGEGNGDPGRNGEPTPFVKGVYPYAAEHGHTLIIDEFMLFVDGVKPLFYPALDGSPYLPEGNVDGSALKIHPDFRIIVTSNPQVRGASLPEPIASRFASTTLTVETSASMLRALDLDEAVVAAWEALGAATLWQPQIREVRLADYWLNLDPTQAASAFVPEHCPETQRQEVRNIVMSFLGGNLREDGRLVVS